MTTYENKALCAEFLKKMQGDYKVGKEWLYH